MAKPFITVLVDTYNHERFIEQAIVSLLEQEFPSAEREILVVDDGSTDHTAAIVRKFVPQVRLLSKPNGGQASAFNTGIPEGRGEIVAFLDGDDWWARDKLAKVVAALERDPAVGSVGHGIIEVAANGQQKLVVLPEVARCRVNTVADARAFRLRKSFLGTSRMTVRFGLLRQIGPVPEVLTIEADEYVFTMAAALADVLILPEALTYYRLHGFNQYQVAGFQAESLRRKQRILASLAGSLAEDLPRRGVPPAAARTVTEVIQTEADMLRLSLEGGYPWETLQVEANLYRILHEGASLPQRLFKAMTLLPALFLPPRFYYGLRRQVARQDWYLRARAKWLPIPAVRPRGEGAGKAGS